MLRLTTVATLLGALALSAAAQTPTPTQRQDLLNAGPRGLVEFAPAARPQPAGGARPAAEASPGQAQAALPLPPDPAASPVPLMFGSQMFSGRFASEAFSGFNPEYQIAVGDRVTVRMWGGFNHEATQAVDAQGNLFIPNVGPVKVLGVRNAELNAIVETQVKRTFRASVGVYATLEAAQPVKVYVTGFVRAPGLYAGLSSDSVLYYLDRAGGIDPARGSYLQVDVLRNGRPRAEVDLYRFLLEGRIDPMQLQDGDTIVVAPRKHTVQVGGEVLNPYVFEFASAQVSAADLLAIARPRPGATHLSIVRKIGVERRSEYHPLSTAANVVIQDGDEVTLTSDKYPGTILVRVEGAHLGERSLVLPYGARLKDAVARLKPAPQANVAALQLYRRSVADRQRELLEGSLRSLETYALTARSATSEEASLRQREGEQILQFVERARRVQTRGQVVLADATGAGETLLEDGDVIRLPEASNVVLVSGEVLMPNALVFRDGEEIESYIRRAGGYTQGADEARVLVVRQDGSIVEALPSARTVLRAGDELMVLPKVETKNIEVTRGITQIIYQIAVAARIALGL
ncbi:MAG: polysaccharide biosynthesis/export family protein [Burkholderiaceae bacterium]|nr:polysaccharide biosynthesis/export family protein [Burkholderiaceae bacterium]